MLLGRFSKFPRKNGKSLYKLALKGFGSFRVPLAIPSWRVCIGFL